MKRHTPLLFFFLMFLGKNVAQKAYFQQEVNYQIAVSLDDKKHALSGTIEMIYHNNAPESLDFIYILLQPNAYKSKNSAFAQQALRNGSTRFYFAEPSEMGRLSDLNFEVEGKKVEVEVDKANPDIAKVKLNTPILSGKSVKITTPFTYKIPFPFSRGGHAGQQYLMTQWYPRPAVYDATGWHPQPYLDQGEFYQEFGSFDVSITLPENYVVGATGVLQTPSEVSFLTEKVKYTEGVLSVKNDKLKIKNADKDSFPPSSDKLKTIRYKADKVIDFAWFADKRFLVLKSEVTLKNSDKKVETYSYFPPKYAATWSKSTDYINRAVQFYSENVGDYPHPQASAVMSDEGFGGGMEYPMITVLKSEVTLKNSDKKVETYSYFPPKYAATWSKSTDYINRAVQFYSENVGDYPHPQASAVMSDEGFGGGMEYPMITVLSGSFDAHSLDNIITHEVGHNWFQGILASNERDNPWLDEGLNSYYDHRYDVEYYGKNTEGFGLPSFITKSSDYNLNELAGQLFSFLHRDQAPMTASDKLTSTNYGLAVYEKTAQSLKILETYVGREKFDEIMQSYFKQWQFKHPQPTDFKKMWTDAAADIGDVSWFFDGLMGSTKQVDYKIVKLSETKEGFWQATVKNVGQVAAPFTVSAVKNVDSAVYTVRLSGIKIGQTTEVLIPKRDDAKLLVVDDKHELPEVNRQNNNVKISGAFKTFEPIRLSLIPRLDNSKRTNLYATPIIGANVYDGAMLGLWFNNGLLPLKKTEWSVAPMYGFRSKTLTGLADVSYHFFAKNNEITLDLEAKRFSFDFNDKFTEPLIYQRYTPSISINFGGNPTSPYRHKIELRHIFLRQQGFTYDTAGVKTGKVYDNSNITELAYSGFIKNALGNTSFRLALENQQYTSGPDNYGYLKTTLDFKRDVVYQKGKRFYARLFVSGFLKNTGRDVGNFYGTRSRGSLGLASRGSNDYRYDGLWMGRNAETTVVSQQIDPTTEGGMKFTLPAGSTTEVGFSNSFVFALNLSLDLPVNLPRFFRVKPYFDLGYFNDTRPASLRSATKTLMSGGIQWDIFGDALSIYVPVYFSGKPLDEDPNSFKALMSKRGGFLDRVTFSLNLNALNPRKLIRNAVN